MGIEREVEKTRRSVSGEGVGNGQESLQTASLFFFLSFFPSGAVCRGAPMVLLFDLHNDPVCVCVCV